MNTWPCSLFFVRWCAVALLCALAACGGGGGGSPGGGGDNQATPGSAVLGAGVFASSVAIVPTYPETVAIVMPSPPANPRWWALRRASASSVSIFSGDLTQDGQGAGSVAMLQAYEAGNVRSGTAALTGVSAAGFYALVSLAANQSVQPPLSSATVELSAVKSGASVYNAASAPDLALLEGDWMGVWVDGLDSRPSATVRIQGGVLSLPEAVFNCSLGAGSALSTVAGANLYRVVLSFPSAQFNCKRSVADATQPARTLEGVAWIHVLSDGRRRLEFVAVDASGSGVVFRAIR